MTDLRIGLLLLASGLSSRFEDGDKLLATLGNLKLVEHVGQLDIPGGAAARIGVVSEHSPGRRRHFEDTGWTCVDNPDPSRGQAHAIAAGIAHLRENTPVEAALILLADMPFIRASHLAKICDALSDDTRAVMASNGKILMPPALFRRRDFVALEALKGDRGARGVFTALEKTRTVDLPDAALLDIDTVTDLENAEARLNG